MNIIDIQDIKKYFKTKDGILKGVDGVSLSLPSRGTTGLVGESGCGKSTLAKLVLRLMEPTGGNILWKGKDIWTLRKDELKAFRKSVQIVFQDPFASLNPRMTVYDTLSEPLKIHKIVEKREIKDRVALLLEKVGLQTEVMSRYPHELSGGQRQRICIARALALNPELIVADEPLSALDVSVQAQILNLLGKIRSESGLSFLFISHDLRVVHYFCDYVYVMYLGKIVESGSVDSIFFNPLHPYTMMLLESVPSVKKKRERIFYEIGDPPSPLNIPEGCPFHPRCPRRFEPCDRIEPVLRDFRGEHEGQRVACHLY